MTTLLPDINPSKSPSDPNLYRHIQLSNGLKVLLIQDTQATRTNKASYIFGNESEDENSDSDTEPDAQADGQTESKLKGEKGNPDDSDDVDSEEVGNSDSEEEEEEEEEAGERKASCSLTVGCGSLFDPPTHPGLSHLLEHMLFMGTVPYPSENHYDRTLSKWGGYDNAYTEMEHTVYYFDVDQSHFFQGLDIFRHFFSTPLLSQGSLGREIKAVQSEFDISLTSDSSRLQQLLCHESDESHPFHTFSWGSEASLNSDPELLNAELRKLFDQYYYAKNMRMTVIGGFDLSVLQRRVENMFNIIPSSPRLKSPYTLDNSTVPAKSSVNNLGYPFSNLSTLNYVIPLKSRHTFNLTYQLPSQTGKYKCKPTDYISHLLGHEAKGSVLTFLKERNLAQSIYAGVGGSGYEDSSGWCLFCVSVEMTEKVREGRRRCSFSRG